MKFENRDYVLSPYTGLTREHWISAGRTLLEGIFRHIPDEDAPVIVARKEMKVTYPHLDAPENVRQAEQKAEIFEGLTRSFLIASVLLHEDPELKVHGISLAEYYRKHILRSCCEKDHPEYVGTYDEMQELTAHKDPFRPFQQTVETCALVIGLWASRSEVWEKYTREEKDRIAGFLSGYAKANTVPQNWRLFNMLDMAFLYQEGYETDRNIMREHAQAILAYDAGDGWYRDGHSFDYYSCWAFQFYTPLWNLWYGYEKEPYLAARFEENSNLLMENYPFFFDREGFTNMWGRSGIYRNASTSALDANFLLRNPTLNPGLARRICSGSLLQFFERDDFLWEGVPVLGFYRQFTPLVQAYSCAESVFWLGKAFFCLHLPADHPFWTSTEENGIWGKLQPREVHETILDGPALAVTNHEANGATILRTGKTVKQADDQHGMWAYAKLCYHTKLPWEAAPAVLKETEPVFGSPAAEAAESSTENMKSTDNKASLIRQDVESQQYVLEDLSIPGFQRGNAVFWHGTSEGVLYRRQFFDYVPEKECHWLHAVNLADFPVPYGLMRADKLRLYKRPMRITLGAYGFPDNGTKISRLKCGKASAILLEGRNHCQIPFSMAMTIYDGWDRLEYLHSVGSNPDSERSVLVYASADRLRQYDASEPYVMISQVITRTDGNDFTEDDIFPIREIRYTDDTHTGAYGPITIILKDGTERRISFDKIEGRMLL